MEIKHISQFIFELFKYIQYKYDDIIQYMRSTAALKEWLSLEVGMFRCLTIRFNSDL